MEQHEGEDYNQFIGKAIKLWTDSMPYEIEGVLKNVPENSHLQFQMLISYRTLVNAWKEADHDFTQSDFWHYVQLKKGADHKAINAQMAGFSQKGPPIFRF